MLSPQIQSSDVHRLGLVEANEAGLRTAARVWQQLARQWLWIDGFSGAGKSTTALRLGHLLGLPVLDLDEFRPPDGFDTTRPYATQVDAERLGAALAAHSAAVICGLCLRDVCIARMGIARSEAMSVYVGKLTRSTTEILTWHDGWWIEDTSTSVGWLLGNAVDYHRRMSPQEDSDLTLYWVENSEPEPPQPPGQ